MDAGGIWGVLNLATGPGQSLPAAVQAMAQPVESIFDPSFAARYEETLGLLARAFGVERAIVLQGESSLALEAAAASLFGPDDTVLNVVSGPYGRAYGAQLRRHAGEVIDLETPYDEVADPEALAAALRRRPGIRGVAVVHCETPCGTLAPMADLGAVAAEHGALLVVDAVSTFGGQEVDPNGWHADVVVGGPHKALAGPPGLALVAVSDRAWQAMVDNPAAPRASYLSLLDWKDLDPGSGLFPVTPFVSCVYALEASLRTYLHAGPEVVWARHALAARAARTGGVAMGLERWARREIDCADTVTAFKVPEGADEAAVRNWLRQRFDALVAPATGEMAGRTLRIGHMGPTASPAVVVAALAGLGAALRAQRVPVEVGAGVEAALEVLAQGS